MTATWALCCSSDLGTYGARSSKRSVGVIFCMATSVSRRCASRETFSPSFAMLEDGDRCWFATNSAKILNSRNLFYARPKCLSAASESVSSTSSPVLPCAALQTNRSWQGTLHIVHLPSHTCRSLSLTHHTIKSASVVIDPLLLVLTFPVKSGEAPVSATATVGCFHAHHKQRIFVSGIDCSFSRGCSIAPVRKTRIESTPGSMTVGPAHWRRS